MHRTRSMRAWAVCLPLAFSWSVEGGEIIHIPEDFPTIQEGIDAAEHGDEIIVAPGTYEEAINFLGKGITLRSSSGPEVTTIDATDKNNSVVRCISGEESDTVLDGFTLTGGTGSPSPFGLLGGGMMNNGSSPVVRNCIFTRNFGPLSGGGMANVVGAGPLISRCLFLENTTDASGGAITNDASSPTILSCVFVDNVAGDFGGAVYSQNCPIVDIVACSFYGNRGCSGGAIAANGILGPLNITNCTIGRNTAVGGGHCGGDGFGGGFFDRSGSIPLVTNTILWGNIDDGGDDSSAQIHITPGNENPVVDFSNVQGGWTGTGTNNIDADPLFADPDKGDLHLLANSPSIDAANNDAIMPEGVDTDLDGNPRFVDDPDTQDTGRGECQIVDMGSYEFQTGGGCCVRIPQWQCDGDVDGDGQVNPVDSGIVQAHFGSQEGLALCNYDVDCDGQINPVDAGIVQSLFGTCEAPRVVCP